MRHDCIDRVEIDLDGRLRIYPQREKFPMIYRSAAEVHWDAEGYLFGPKPREWNYFDWFRHILSVVESEYGTRLSSSGEIDWVNVEVGLRDQIIRFLA